LSNIVNAKFNSGKNIRRMAEGVLLGTPHKKERPAVGEVGVAGLDIMS
jgi:hypothetical protein